MKRKTKQIIIMIVVFLLALTMLSPLFAMSDTEFDKFSKDEAYYQKLCGNYGPEDAETCSAFKDFKNEKIKRAKGDIKDAQMVLKEIKGEIKDEEAKLKQYHEEIEALEKDIISNEVLISQTEYSIIVVEKQIQEREERIEELDILIKEFLVNMQGEMRVNGFIEFIMGASDFSDIVRRSEGMKRIKEYNESLINEVLEEQELLEADKSKLEGQKNQLEDEKEFLVVQVEKSKALKNVIDGIVAELRKQQKTQEELVEQSASISKAEQENLSKIFEKVVLPDGGTSGGHASTGWIYPVSGNFRVGDGVWSYGSGGKHLGQDYPAAIGTTLAAPANGVVIAAKDSGCSDNYNINDRCNGGWGNYLNMIVNVGGNYYGLLYAHITPGGMLSSSGQQVSAGQAVAKVGSSGQSSGPHLHVEVYYLGTDTATAAGYYTTNTFGTGGSSSERGNSRCHMNGNTAPCRMNPRAVFP